MEAEACPSPTNATSAAVLYPRWLRRAKVSPSCCHAHFCARPTLKVQPSQRRDFVMVLHKVEAEASPGGKHATSAAGVHSKRPRRASVSSSHPRVPFCARQTRNRSEVQKKTKVGHICTPNGRPGRALGRDARPSWVFGALGDHVALR